MFFAVICFLKEFNRFPANIVFFGACVLGAVSIISLIVFSIITGAQDGKYITECCIVESCLSVIHIDTCSLDWSRTRDASIIVALLLALVCNGCFLLASRLKKSIKFFDY